jgi:hypothetical protein
MSAIAIDISEFTDRIREMIANLKRDEKIIISINTENQPVVSYVAANGQSVEPSEVKPKRRRAGTAEGTFWMSPDFNEPLEEFKEYME